MNPRIEALTTSAAPSASAAILQQVQSAIGMTPNLHKTLAHSPAALKAYTSIAAALGAGTLDAPLRESLAIAIAARNHCGYCASAHTAIGKGLQIEDAELRQNLEARSSSPRTEAALQFAMAVIEHRGDVPDTSLQTLRAAGFDEAELVELLAHVGMNTFSNLFNRAARTAIDFPEVQLAATR